jgi:hypothetical protein
MRRRIAAAVIAVVAVVVVEVGTSVLATRHREPQDVRPPAPSGPVDCPAGGVEVDASAHAAGPRVGIGTSGRWPTSSRMSNVRVFQRQAGVRIRIFRLYESITQPPLSAGDLAIGVSAGALVVSMNVPRGASWSALLQHRYDDDLAAWARSFVCFGRRGGRLFLIALTQEPENPALNRGSAEEYVAAARYYVEFMRAYGVRARYVFAPEAFDFGAKMSVWYPGDDVIDVLAPDGYDWNGPSACDADKSFSSIFAPVHQAAVDHGKLWGVSETGVAYRPWNPGYQASWLAEAGRALVSWRSDLAYVAYWYNNITTARCDWSFHAPPAFAQFGRMAEVAT